MSTLETIKRTLERVTGIGRPSRKEAVAAVRPRKAWTSKFRDDGEVPNNRKLPFVVYHTPVNVRKARDPAALFEQLFEANGWGDSWRNGIYDYVHYHPRTHEVLGVARGEARVRFGGKHGKIVRLKAGDVAVLPAGTGHQAVTASKDLLVVGAYPASGEYDEYEGNPEEHARALRSIPKVRLPKRDPVYGSDGPLMKLWRKR